MAQTKTTRAPQVRLYHEDEAIIDGFAGGGGASTGIEMALGRSPDVAINHDPIALAMHEANHPKTDHIVSNIRHVRYEDLLPGQRIGLAWFSPDCTHHSKARGGKPFRDKDKARRIRGLAWEAVRCAKARGELKPRIIMLENVEEWRDWCPLLSNGLPNWARRGENYRRWKRSLAACGYAIEERELLACDYGAPTKRKRLFVIARCDGHAIVWPEPTHGPGRRRPYRTAAECLDFTLPVPSIFLTPTQAKAWARAHGLPESQAPRRPLATATKRRIARGIQRFVIDAARPFIIPVNHSGGPGRVYSADVPLNTITCAPRGEFALVAPILAGVGGRRGQSPELPANRPLPTITSKADTVVIVPTLMLNSETRRDQLQPGDEPIRTLTASNARTYQMLAATLINTRNGERKGQAPRVMDVDQPFPTVTAVGSQGALVAAFLAKHHGNDTGHDATGQHLTAPVDTITTKNSKAVVTSHLVKLRGNVDTHPRTEQDLREPLPALTANGTHYAEIRAFLVKYYGTKKDGRPCDVPLDTITTKERYGLVTVTIDGEQYAIVDIGMRMLTPRELFRCQGFPADYEIDTVPVAKGFQKLTKKAQTRLVGNSVPPHMSAALVAANTGRYDRYLSQLA